MDGTLVVNEERGKVNKFKQWYQQKIVDTGLSGSFEKREAMVFDNMSKSVKFVGDSASVVCSFIPGFQIAVPLCSTVGRLQSKFYKFGGNLVIQGKRFIEGKIIGVDGSSKDIIIPDFNSEQVLNTVNELANGAVSLVSEAQELESVGKML